MKKVIGLTGGIASGKSTVVDFLISKGYQVIDADQVVRQLQLPGGKLYEAIVSHFGRDFIDSSGQLDRAKLGKLVFADPNKRHELSTIQDDIIRQELYAQRARLLEKTEIATASGDKKFADHLLMTPSVDEVFFMDIPLLLEYNYTGFDEIWLVYIDETTQLERLMARNHFTKEEAKQRIAAQMPLWKKREVADRILDNSGSIAELEKQVEDALMQLNRKKRGESNENC
ncbi:dephospho-CoA kinase [Lactococcus taiwanensis]|uniref:dephospho-CoA kinase n=1 Tax=Lactococcus taiwanensis TaxID=1151742 RepID=UPI0028A17CF2|nr:dephospho-CoA kinase [Lactococcus taiwanensis]